MITLIIPRVPESYNKVVKFSGWERQAYQALWSKEVLFAFTFFRELHRLPQLPFKKAKVTFWIYFPDKKHRDKVNVAGGLKYALDALTVKRGVGIVEDDENYPTVKCDDYYFLRYDRDHPRTVIEIEEVR